MPWSHNPVSFTFVLPVLIFAFTFVCGFWFDRIQRKCQGATLTYSVSSTLVILVDLILHILKLFRENILVPYYILFSISNPMTAPVLFIPGEMPLSGSDMCVPALLGMEYPDPMGSGLSVPVLGCQTDLMSEITIPLAGTMEDPDGKGTVKNKPRSKVNVYVIHFQI